MRDLLDYQSKYQKLPFEEIQAEYRKKNILETLSRLNPESILEVGCGLDSLFNHYLNFKNFKVIEPGELFYETALHQSKGDGRIQVIHGNLQDNLNTLGDKHYDLILLSSLLHELPECESILSATLSLCDEDTTVHINVPNAHSLHRMIAYEAGLIGDLHERSDTQIMMQQFQTFSVESLKDLVIKNGFDIVDCGTFFIKPFTHNQMDKLRELEILTPNILDALYALSKSFPSCGSEIYMNIKRAVNNVG